MRHAEIDIWWLDADAEEAAQYTGTLSPEERDRSRTFRRPEDRHRYEVRHGMLRALLAQQLCGSPAEVPLAVDPLGKPFVRESDVRFSISKSANVALFAITRQCEIGCDVERIRPEFATPATAEIALSPRELALFRNLREPARCAMFFTCWTCKEAYLKARGVGLQTAPTAITLGFDEPLRFLELPDDDPARWKLLQLSFSPTFAAALAVRDGQPISPRLHCGDQMSVMWRSQSATTIHKSKKALPAL